MTLLLVLACGSEPAADIATPATPASPSVDEPSTPPAYAGLFADDPALAPADVAVMDPETLVLTRNEVFARHGRTFKTDAIREHFEAQPWYVADPNYDDAMLTDNDKANADLIKSFEGASDPLKVGEYSGDPPMMFVDGKTVTLMWGEGMYEHLNVTHNWTARGDYVVTWTGSETFDATSKECQEATLWKLDHEDKLAEQVASLKAG